MARGDHLRQVHDMYRRGLAQVGDVLEQVRSGQLSVGEARGAVNALGVRVTFEQLGSFCGQLCQSVETHHSIEDAHLYPALRAADPALDPVLDRLDLEHRVIHDVLERFDRVLVAMAHGDAGPGSAAEGRTACPTCTPTSSTCAACWSRTSATRRTRSVRRWASTASWSDPGASPTPPYGEPRTPSRRPGVFLCV